MAHQGVEKDLKELDPVGIETNSPLHADDVAENPESPSPADFEKARLDEKYPQSTAKPKPDLERKTSETTDITELSSITQIKSKAEPTPKRSRWDRWNPIKKKPPPIPEHRVPSYEHSAGWFSLLTWGWVTPLMSVRSPSQSDRKRLTINLDWIFSTFGTQ